MRIRFMFHKVVSLFLALWLLFLCTSCMKDIPKPNKSDRTFSLKEQQEGRTLLVGAATLYGLSLYGPGTARLLEIESGSQFAGLELLIGGGLLQARLQRQEIIGSVSDDPI